MKFSLFFELQIANPTASRERQLFHDCLAQAQLADELGYHGIWEVEHHGLSGYSHSSAPEVFLSFVAATTKRIRIGHGCTLLPYQYNHPIRVAERIATLDILSNGRVNWGSAKSASKTEQGAFQIDRASLHDQWLEALAIIPQMWAAETFCYKGRFFDIPHTRLVPKPVQAPHPPMFAACSQPEQAAAVGRLGLGALNLAMYHDELLARRIQEYRAGIAAAKPIGQVINNHFTCNPATLVLKDDRQACRYGLTGATYFNKMLLHYYGPERAVGPADISTDPVPEPDVQAFRDRRNTPRSQLSSIIGDPHAARESVQRFVDVGVDELILVMQTGTTPHEVTMESIRTFATDVMPYFS